MILDYRKSTFESLSTNNDLNARAKNLLFSNFDYLFQQSIDSFETRLKSKRLEISMKSKSSIVVNSSYRISTTSKTTRQSSVGKTRNPAGQPGAGPEHEGLRFTNLALRPPGPTRLRPGQARGHGGQGTRAGGTRGLRDTPQGSKSALTLKQIS